jgi:saccharopine dehydrogenase (NAD+, L-lysine forming)
MSRALIVGAGGVANVVAHKCCQNPEVFEEICIASRTLEKCEKIKNSIPKTRTRIRTVQMDADDVGQIMKQILKFAPDIVIHVALPYQDLTIMEACLATGVNYLDTANYEAVGVPKFEYKQQWSYHEKFRQANLTAVLGSGFDPGVTGVFCAYAIKHYFDEIHTIDILDANDGDHGYPFATNFNPEINIREITAKGRYFKDGKWIETLPLEHKKVYHFPEIGNKDIYLLYHEELESLSRNIPGIRQIRFWMTFSEKYLRHLTVLQNVGMTSIEPIDFEGKKIAPLRFLKAVLPDPASLGSRTKGKTNIGCVIRGVKNGQEKQYYIYNICDHEKAYREVGSQAISYTTGVPAMIGAMMVLKELWNRKGVYNVEEFDPDPFMEQLNQQGLPWIENFAPDFPDDLQ